MNFESDDETYLTDGLSDCYFMSRSLISISFHDVTSEDDETNHRGSYLTNVSDNSKLNNVVPSLSSPFDGVKLDHKCITLNPIDAQLPSLCPPSGLTVKQPVFEPSLDVFHFIEVQSIPRSDSLNPIDYHITSMHPQSELTKKQERTSLKFAEQSLPKVSLPLMCNRDRILSLFRACQENVLLKGRSKEVVLATCIHAELSLYSPTSVKILKNIVSAYTNIPITEENIRPVITAMKQNDYFGLYKLNIEPTTLNNEPTSDVILHLSHQINVDDVHKKEIITLAETILHDIFFRKLKKNKGKTNEAVAVYFALCTISLKYNYPTITLKDYFNNIVEAAREVLGRRQLPLLKSLRTNLDRIIQDNASILQQHGVRWFS